MAVNPRISDTKIRYDCTAFLNYGQADTEAPFDRLFGIAKKILYPMHIQKGDMIFCA